MVAVYLKVLLNHITERFCLYLDVIIEMLPPDTVNNLELISKWGCDGSQQSLFKQKFANEDSSDMYLFQSSFVPL
jgi:hypothetical protein